MPKWINTIVVVVAIAIVSAILAVAVNGQPAEGNDPGLQSFGVFTLFLLFAAVGVTIFLVGRCFPWKTLDGEASRTLASNSSPDNGRPYSEVKHTCSTTVRQVGTGHTQFCGGKTVVGEEENR
jgi:hypothetical protein